MAHRLSAPIICARSDLLVTRSLHHSSGNVFIPSGVNQSAIAVNLTSAIGLFVFLPSSCTASITPYACLLAFQPCDSSGQPLPLCPDVCTATLDDCRGTLAESRLPPCDALNNSLGYPYFETGSM